jgi:hypothetical protein
MKDVSLPTDQRGGKMTKSATAVPGFREGQVSTVKMLGSMWSKLRKEYSKGPSHKIEMG